MSGTGEEGADRLRVGGWVPRKDPRSGGEADPQPPADHPEPQPPAGDTEPAPSAGDTEPAPASALPDPEPVPPGQPRPRFGVPAKVVAAAVAVVAILTVLAVAAYQSMTHAPAASPAGAGTEPSSSRVAVPPVDASGVPAPSASPSGTPSASPSPSLANSPAPGPTGPTPVPDEVVANGGFESGTLAGWNCTNKLNQVVTSPVHSGRYALAGDPNGGRTAQCSQTVPVQPGKRYTLSAWASGDHVYLGVSGAGLPEPQAFTASATYTQLQVTFVAPAGTSSVTIWVHGWYVPGTYYADDISLR
jgi:chitinase